MRKALLMLLAVALVFSVLAGCAKAAKKAPVEFIIANNAEPETIDPHRISGVPEHRIYMALFEGLITYDPKTARGIPGLAESWTISADQTVYTFKLRKTTWSDGTPITAKTVVDSWLRELNPETASPYAWFPAMAIKGAKEYNEKKAGPEAVKIKAVDDYTFQVELVGPLPYVTDMLPHYAFAVVPMHVIQKFGKDWVKPENFVCNGPFKLESWKPQEKLTVVPNPKYWDKDKVKLERVVYLPSDDNNTNYNMFINGEVDLVVRVPLDQMEAAKQRPDFQNAPYLGTYYYIFQNEKKPFSDPRVRKAFTMAINRKDLVEKVTKGGELAAYSMVPPMAGYTPIEGNKEDVEQAKKLLAEAGFPGGKKFPKFQLLYNTHEGHKKIAEYIQQQWKQNLGIDCELVNQEWKTFLNTRRQGDFLVARAGWIGDYQDPNTFLDMFVTGGGENNGRYSNKKFDELIEKAAKMPAGPERFNVLRQAEEFFVTQDQGVMPIYTYTTTNMIDLKKWGGWYTNIMDFHPPKDIYKIEAAKK
jgi:oligopeptide transport system substrate-binding protein